MPSYGNELVSLGLDRIRVESGKEHKLAFIRGSCKRDKIEVTVPLTEFLLVVVSTWAARIGRYLNPYSMAQCAWTRSYPESVRDLYYPKKEQPRRYRKSYYSLLNPYKLFQYIRLRRLQRKLKKMYEPLEIQFAEEERNAAEAWQQAEEERELGII